jgi:hypothetical protein
MVAYNNAADDSEALKGLQNIVDQHVALLQKAKLYLPFKYLNYADVSQDPFSSYGKRNKAHLEAVSERYDPKKVFQKGVPGGFKLFA